MNYTAPNWAAETLVRQLRGAGQLVSMLSGPNLLPFTTVGWLGTQAVNHLFPRLSGGPDYVLQTRIHTTVQSQ